MKGRQRGEGTLGWKNRKIGREEKPTRANLCGRRDAQLRHSLSPAKHLLRSFVQAVLRRRRGRLSAGRGPWGFSALSALSSFSTVFLFPFFPPCSFSSCFIFAIYPLSCYFPLSFFLIHILFPLFFFSFLVLFPRSSFFHFFSVFVFFPLLFLLSSFPIFFSCSFFHIPLFPLMCSFLLLLAQSSFSCAVPAPFHALSGSSSAAVPRAGVEASEISVAFCPAGSVPSHYFKHVKRKVEEVR